MPVGCKAAAREPSVSWLVTMVLRVEESSSAVARLRPVRPRVCSIRLRRVPYAAMATEGWT